MKNSALVAYYRELGTMLEAGVPIISALESLGAQSGHRLKAASARMAAMIGKGLSLSRAFAAQGRLFPAQDIGMITAAEHTGRLDVLLRTMADTHERMIKMGKTIAIRLIYPVIVVHVAIFAAAVLRWTVNKQISDSLALVAWACGIIYGGGFVCYLLLFSEKRIVPLRHLLDSLVNMLPVAGGLCRCLATARFARTFEGLCLAGLGYPQSVKIAAESCGNLSVQKKFKRALPLLAGGANLAEALAHTRVLRPMHMSMIATGERSGKLEEMLAKVAESCEDSANARTKVLATVIPVLLYLAVAIYVGIFVVRFWLSYFSELNGLLDGVL